MKKLAADSAGLYFSQRKLPRCRRRHPRFSRLRFALFDRWSPKRRTIRPVSLIRGLFSPT